MTMTDRRTHNETEARTWAVGVTLDDDVWTTPAAAVRFPALMAARPLAVVLVGVLLLFVIANFAVAAMS